MTASPAAVATQPTAADVLEAAPALIVAVVWIVSATSNWSLRIAARQQ